MARMTRDEFMVYLTAKNNMEYDKMQPFVTDDIVLEFSDDGTKSGKPPRIVRGREDYFAHFKKNHTSIREYMDLGFFLSDEENVLTEQYTEFHALEDQNNPSGGAVGNLKKGEVLCTTNWLCYNFAPDGRFNRVRIAHHVVHYWPPKHDPTTE